MSRYSVGYDERTACFFEERTADTHAQFLLDYLVPGMDLLDDGCGPGTITKGLAEIVTQHILHSQPMTIGRTARIPVHTILVRGSAYRYCFACVLNICAYLPFWAKSCS